MEIIITQTVGKTWMDQKSKMNGIYLKKIILKMCSKKGKNE